MEKGGGEEVGAETAAKSSRGHALLEKELDDGAPL